MTTEDRDQVIQDLRGIDRVLSDERRWTQCQLSGWSPEGGESYCLFGAHNHRCHGAVWWTVESIERGARVARALGFRGIEEAVSYNDDESTTFAVLKRRIADALERLTQTPSN